MTEEYDKLLNEKAIKIFNDLTSIINFCVENKDFTNGYFFNILKKIILMSAEEKTIFINDFLDKEFTNFPEPKSNKLN